MRFLADENMPGGIVARLRQGGQDVVWVRTAAPGMSDRDVLAWAVRDARVLLTFDKDFGELAYNARLPSACGVVLLRIPVMSLDAISDAIAERTDWVGHFSVIEPGRIRMRTLAGDE